MDNSWEQYSCEAMQAHFALYSVPEAAARWCGVPDGTIDTVVAGVKPLAATGKGRGIYVHSEIPCIKPRSMAIAQAIEEGALPHCRENGERVPDGEHAAYERRHVYGSDLKAWMQVAFPNERPRFLFDEIEQNTHAAISASAYRALIAERDELQSRLRKARSEFRALRNERDDLAEQVGRLNAAARQQTPPGQRAESTYLNMVAALLGCLRGDVPGIDRHPAFANESAIITAIAEFYDGYPGLSESNLSRKFPLARRHLEAS